MTAYFDSAPAPIRDDLRASLERVWPTLGQPGTWLDGATRLAIAAETRNAWNCRLCLQRKGALSPYAVEGEHDTVTDLPAALVDAIHRIATDSGRLKRSWVEDTIAAGIPEQEYVEAISVMVIVHAVDCFARGIGMDPPPLPDVVAGDPSCAVVADGQDNDLCWVTTITPASSDPDIAELYSAGPPNIARALSSVPREALKFWDLMHRMYLVSPMAYELGDAKRDINRAQIELIASRASSVLGCFY